MLDEMQRPPSPHQDEQEDHTHVIWKYPLDDLPEQAIEMPEGAEVLHAGVELAEIPGNPDEVLCRVVVWAGVEPEAPLRQHIIIQLMTGEKMPCEVMEATNYITTVQRPDGIVLHIFDGPEIA